MKPLDTNADPRVVGPFELLARLGEGGMGVAYLARRIPLDGLSDELAAAYNLVEPDGDAAEVPRLVVVKLIQPKLLDGEPQYRERFGREIDAVRAVVSDRVPALIAFEEDPAADRPWFAMDYIAGPSLRTMIKDSGTFGIGPYAALGLALVDALRAIHGANLLHRDLKPDNVVLGPDGPVILDFGLAVLIERSSSQALTKSGTGMGTVSYMPLEQYKDAKHASRPADVYALAATLFFALTGRSPYPHGPSASEPKWDGVDVPFLPLLAKTLVSTPSQRPDLDAVEESLLTLLADADLAPDLAAQQLKELVESAALTPELPPGALVDPVDPEVQDLARKAIDADLPDMDPGFYGVVDTDEIELAVDEIEPAPEPAAPQPTPTSYPLPPPRAPKEPNPGAPQAPPRAAQKVAADLRKRYAHRGNL
ncbi:serine/threonine protein kinase [Streptomyces sp. MBT65]|uniref:serine/threonine-protein kinase n=1 Tax=Streptomyces sp. MBT65 TaxID=1488395 RepID=UPI00190A02AB|nr:serine/threonine-protein kinase [Streptomyces sp. MBT65]MBK3580361.1 serine/threonine protein kinase [Streptomyces sp. MBT65]